MDIIPVIDIKDGIAVHARAGQRATYPPLVSRFAAGHDPVEIVQGLSSALKPRSIYIADLDAIIRHAPNLNLIATLSSSCPSTRFLLDGGIKSAAQLAGIMTLPNVDLVLGTESLESAASYQQLLGSMPAERILLSLDQRDGTRMGLDFFFDTPSLWPQRVVHMNLSHVGGILGPDLVGLEKLLEKAAGRQVIAAGGVRGQTDLQSLANLGVSAVLVGSALHDGRLDSA